jgi:phosphoribosyl-ATP pyrophosphohydrolase
MAETGPEVLARISAVIAQRRGADPARSYVARRLGQGRHQVAKKLGEEAVECALAAVDGSDDALVAESADLLFHLLILWAACDVAPDRIYAELARREGTSGLDEKRQRRAE